MDTRTKILSELERLVQQPGYIYIMCMIIINDLTWNLKELQNSNAYDRLCINEILLLIGFFIKKPIDLKYPDSIDSLQKAYEDTYFLLSELHNTFFEETYELVKRNTDPEDPASVREGISEHSNDLIVEAIFYGGESIYDFQYLDYIGRKYKYDKDHLKVNYNYDIDTIYSILLKLQGIQEHKRKRVHHNCYIDQIPEFKKEIEEKQLEITSEELKKTTFMMFLYQFRDMMEGFDNISESIKQLCNNVLDTLSVDVTDYNSNQELLDFLNRYSLEPGIKCNAGFEKLTDNNVFSAKPVLKLSKGKHFIPILLSLFRAAYESPYYWLINDINFKDTAAYNRGKIGEEITFDIIGKVFGSSNTFTSVQINEGRNSLTDIDVLCLLGHYAIIVQVKSKKLTELAKTGNKEIFERDFKLAVQDAYEQGLKSRDVMLQKGITLLDKDRKLVRSQTHFKDIFIMCVTTENIASLSYIVNTRLKIKENDPYPLILSIFDLEILTHYMNDPYDFLYYVKQRSRLNLKVTCVNEIGYLSYHLTRKLWLPADVDYVSLDQSLAYYIDKDYYAYRLGLQLKNADDSFNTRWHNSDFDKICADVKDLDSDFKVDIIFLLFDLNGSSRDKVTNNIIECKNRANLDGKFHNVTVCFDDTDNKTGMIGISYTSEPYRGDYSINERLEYICTVHKYKMRSNYWIGLGNYTNSKRLVNFAYLDFGTWVHSDDLDVLVNEYENLIKHHRKETKMSIGRNDLCPCGSGEKYKKCCGRKV